MRRKRSEDVLSEPKKKRTRGREYENLVSVSLIIYLLDGFSDWIYHSLIEGFFGRIFTAYSSEEAAFQNGFIKSYFKGNGRFSAYFRKVRQFIASRFESSFLLGKIHDGLLSLQTLSLRAYGNFLMSFGIYTVVIYFIKMVLPMFDTPEIGFLLTGAIISIISVPLLASGQTLASAVGKSHLTRTLFVQAFGFREESFEVKSHSSKRRGNVMILLGMLCGVLTIFVHPIVFPLLLLAFALVVLVLATPEVGIVSILFLLPFFSYLSYPTLALTAAVLLTFMSYVFKLLRGKRILKIEFLDVCVLFFMVAIYFGGAISVGGKSSYYSALVSCALMLGYFLIVNLMRTKEWILRCFKAMVASATIVSCMAIVQYIFGRLNRSTLDLRYFSNIKGRVTVIFGNANLLGFYLAMVFPLALYFLLQTSGLKKKILPFCSCLAFLFAIVFTWSRGAWLALLVSLLVFLLIYTRKTLRYLVLLLLATPLAVFWLPDSVRQRFLSIGSFSDSSVAYRLYTWKGTWQAIKEYFVSGVGYGDEAYAQIYPAFAYSGMETAPHSHNLFLQILFSLGIFGLLIFLVIAFLFIQRNLENIKSTKDRSVRFLNTALLCSGISVFTMGLFDYVWYHYRVFFLFWILLGLSAALSRVDRAEQYRKNLLDIPDPQSASVDIAL